MRTNLLIFGGLTLGFLLILSVRPVNTSPENWLPITAKVNQIDEQGGPGDITIHLYGSESTYYINRGTEHRLIAEQLNRSLVGQEVTVFYAEHFTPLDPFGNYRHVTRMVWNDSILYEEGS